MFSQHGLTQTFSCPLTVATVVGCLGSQRIFKMEDCFFDFGDIFNVQIGLEGNALESECVERVTYSDLINDPPIFDLQHADLQSVSRTVISPTNSHQVNKTFALDNFNNTMY